MEKTVLTAEAPPSYPGVVVSEPCQVAGSTIRPPNYLPLTFFALLCCCCWPAFIFAIIGFVFSVQVDHQYTTKDYLGAQRSSKNARVWSVAAIATGLTMVLVYIIFELICHLLGSDGEGSGHGAHQ